MSLTTTEQETKEYLEYLTSLRVDKLLPDEYSSDTPHNFIGKELEFAAYFLLKHLPEYYVYDCIEDGTVFQVESIDDHASRILLPGNFLRFIRLKMQSWKRPLDTLVGRHSKEYKRQEHPISRGTVQRPVAVMVPFVSIDESKRNKAIELYPGGDDIITEFAYVYDQPYYTLPKSLYDPLTWYAASRILSGLRQSGPAQSAFQNMLQLIGGKLIGIDPKDLQYEEVE